VVAQVDIYLSRKTTSQLGHDHPHPAHVPAGRGSEAVQTLHGSLPGEPEKLPAGPESDGGAVKVQLRSRPATPVMSLRAQQPDNKLSSSLSDLRQ